MDLSYLNQYWKRGQGFLGVKYPIICGAMTWISESNLVSTVCNQGAFGVLAGGNAPAEVLEKEIDPYPPKDKQAVRG